MARARQSTTNPDEKTEVLPFEEAARELDGIVRALEEERLPLDDLVERYERGMLLLRQCQEQLDNAQQRISLITTNSKGTSTAPFDPDAPVASPSLSARKSSAAPTASDDDEIRLF